MKIITEIFVYVLCIHETCVISKGLMAGKDCIGHVGYELQSGIS